MTTRRDTLQRISRIDNINTAQDAVETEIPCGHFVGVMTIEAALDLYMTEISSPIIINFCLLPEQYRRKQGGKQPEPDCGGETPQPDPYDLLDANRSSGFWFYSYDKHGVHSILGEQRAGGCGDYI